MTRENHLHEVSTQKKQSYTFFSTPNLGIVVASIGIHTWIYKCWIQAMGNYIVIKNCWF